MQPDIPDESYGARRDYDLPVGCFFSLLEQSE